jgi:hypothetical protein
MESPVDHRDPSPASYPVSVHVQPMLGNRNRLTTAFRFFLALPHLILVGGPIAIVNSMDWSTDQGWNFGYGSGGVLSIVACVVTLIVWFAILFTGRHPEGLWKLVAYYLRWRVHAIAYITLLRDEYPPFGEGDYPAELGLEMPHLPRNRLTVFFRLFLALPHIIVLWLLSMAWALTTAIAWVVILFTGRYPEALYGFALGVLAWSVRVEAYVLLLRDEYPPFTLRT